MKLEELMRLSIKINNLMMGDIYKKLKSLLNCGKIKRPKIFSAFSSGSYSFGARPRKPEGGRKAKVITDHVFWVNLNWVSFIFMSFVHLFMCSACHSDSIVLAESLISGDALGKLGILFEGLMTLMKHLFPVFTLLAGRWPRSLLILLCTFVT